MLNQEAESNTVAEDRDGWVYLLAVLLWFVGIVIGGKIMLSILHHEEKPLSDVKAWGIESVEQMPYVQGEHKQEILNQINEANQNVEVQGIVCQAQKDNDEIRVLVAAQRLQSHDYENAGNK